MSEKLIIKKGWWWKLYFPWLGTSSGRWWWQSTHCSNEDSLEVCIWELVSYLQNSESGKNGSLLPFHISSETWQNIACQFCPNDILKFSHVVFFLISHSANNILWLGAILSTWWRKNQIWVLSGKQILFTLNAGKKPNFRALWQSA